MAQIQNIIKAELDPTKPVPEACQVIQSLICMYPPIERPAILRAIQDELDVAIKQVEGAESNGKQIREPGRK
ncbi:hypothetical protein M3201_18685 [Paenibacillus motobuensis]|uniref:hypothetical protein n=1 Tax=Paenibacillus TaxID=44249 RepID=UPI0020414D96|nr:MULTISPECIES: hypothetical protein [Paenibacillus]MCM3041724.1 hypothetical protein [Paenibacillus lutimineralis]MCM3648828.1 hypothetical protein [Paenibacillus motobuensis]